MILAIVIFCNCVWITFSYVMIKIMDVNLHPLMFYRINFKDSGSNFWRPVGLWIFNVVFSVLGVIQILGT
jgi:hypothetical protein